MGSLLICQWFRRQVATFVSLSETGNLFRNSDVFLGCLVDLDIVWLQAEFSGGVLVCNDVVAVKKVSLLLASPVCVYVCVCVCVCQRKTKDRADGMREKSALCPRRDSNLYLWDTRPPCCRLHHEGRARLASVETNTFCVCARACACVCVCLYVYVCVFVCVRVSVCLYACTRLSMFMLNHVALISPLVFPCHTERIWSNRTWGCPLPRLLSCTWAALSTIRHCLGIHIFVHWTLYPPSLPLSVLFFLPAMLSRPGVFSILPCLSEQTLHILKMFSLYSINCTFQQSPTKTHNRHGDLSFVWAFINFVKLSNAIAFWIMYSAFELHNGVQRKSP